MRPIPPLLFRIVGVALLVAAIALPTWWAVTDRGPYRWLVGVLPFDAGFAALLAFLLVLLGCLLLILIPILALRQLTAGMPTMADEAATLKRMKGGDFSDADALLRSSTFVRSMGIVMLLVGAVILGLGYVLLRDTGWIHTTLIAVGGVFGTLGLVAAVSGRMPQRERKRQRPRHRPYRQDAG